MVKITLTISAGLRLHFYLNAGCYGRYVGGRLNNKEQMMLHLIKDLKWQAKLFDDEDVSNQLFMEWVKFEAEVDESLGNALKALMRMRSLSRKDLERLKGLPLGEACKELTAMSLLEGGGNGDGIHPY